MPVVTSVDGTTVEYVSHPGSPGPQIIVVPGALAEAADLGRFAELLTSHGPVHVVQRRGRGGSGPQGPHYGMAREVEDIAAIAARTGARLIFGHSFGGLVALRAAGGFDAIAGYEPGVSVDGSIPVGWIDRARAEAAAGANLDAFVTFVRGINPESSGRAPRWLLRIILRRALSPTELRRDLALMPQAINEHVEVGRLDQHVADYGRITAPTLLIHGTARGSARQAGTLARLASVIPDARTAALPGLDHFAPEKNPGPLAAAVLDFFAAHADRVDSLP
jgi:pimeloyl-ACP methyl ester carboxylesterase